MTAIMTGVLVLIQQIMPRGLRSDTEEMEDRDAEIIKEIEWPYGRCDLLVS